VDAVERSSSTTTKPLGTLSSSRGIFRPLDAVVRELQEGGQGRVLLPLPD